LIVPKLESSMPCNRLPPSVAALSLFLLLGAAPGWAQTQPARINGDVVQLAGQDLELRSSSGEKVAVKLSDKLRVSARSPGDVRAIKQGDFVGVTAVPQPDGTLLASDVQVFPESMRGTGEGHRPMSPDSGAGAGSTMTNATVATVAAGKPANTMTNATVSNVAAGDGSVHWKLTYKGGEKDVVVPSTATIMITEIVDTGALVPGTHVVAYVTKQPDGVLTSERVSVGKNGYVPPR